MHHRALHLISIALILLVTAPFARSQEAQPTSAPSTRGQRPGRDARGPASHPSEKEEPEPVTTDHQLTVDGQAIKYKATAGTITLKDDQDKPRGRMFFVAYTKSAPDDSDYSDRPVTFVFNGGPGAAAIWLHLGTAGPKRVVLPNDGAPPSPPYKLEDNASSWLDLTDLVLIDPVGTGYSRPEPDKGREFYGVRGDLDSVSDFIRIYLTKYQRWLSPKFLAGESYGTTRAAGLSEQLHDRYGIDLNGIVLMSTVLNFQTLDFGPGNDTPYPLYVPSYSAIAHFHKKLAPDLQQRKMTDVVRDAQAWAMGDYSQALLRGTSLSPDERDMVAQQLARFSGLPLEYVKRSNLRVNPNRFEKELLAEQNKVIGRMDGRFTGHNADPLNDTPEYDPTLSGYVGVFANTFNDYVRRQLKYESELTYEFLSPRVGPWDFGPGGNGYLNVATTLRRCMVKLPQMKVMVCSGYYDLATPFAGADYTINQLPLDEPLRKNVLHRYYEGGHMFYLNHSALEQLKKDLGEFFDTALSK